MKKTRRILLILLLFISSHLSQADINVEGRLTHELDVEAGGTYTGMIVLKNMGEAAEEVKLYQTDYESTAEGYHYYHDPNTTPRSNAAWLTISPRRFLIPAGGTYTVHYTIKIPDDSSLVGTYWSILMVEPIPGESPESKDFDPEKTSMGVMTVLRFAIRMITHMGGTGSVQPQIIASRLMAEQDKRLLYVDIANTGTRLLRILLWSELYTEEGDFVGKYDGERLALFPGSSLRFKVDLTDVPKSKYKALVVIDCGNNDVFGANYTLLLE